MSTYPSLGGVRGICSILIVTGHFFTFFAPTNPNKYPTATIDYLPPVSIFFIMSGFLLGVIYQDKLDDWNQRKDFWIKRFARIAPMYYFSLLIAIPVVIAYTNTFGLLTSLILSPLFLQSLTLVGNEWNGPLWQCSALALCYLIYPFFLKFIRNRNPWIWGTVFYLFSLALYIGTLIIEAPAIAHIWFIARAPHFFIGVIMGIKYPKHDPDAMYLDPLINTEQGQTVRTPMPRMKDTILLELLTVFLFAVFLVCSVLGFTSVGDEYWWLMSFTEEFALIPVYCLWLYYLCRARRGMTFAFFTSWPMERLGDLSYSIYVLHFPMIFLFSWLKEQKVVKMQKIEEHNTDAYGPFALENYELLSVLGIIICAAALTFHYIENPAREWIIKRYSPRKPVKAHSMK